MIVSHKLKAIFLHSRKTGGSAVKLNLYPFLGQHDIIVGGLTEILDAKHKLNQASRAALRSPSAALAYTLSRLRGRSHSQAANLGIKRHYNHLAPLPEHATADDIQALFPKEFDEYYKFAFVRNPYTQIVSDFFWRRRNTGRDISFAQYIDMLAEGGNDNFVHRGGVSNFDIITRNGSVACDFIGRFENIESDFAKAAGALGINCRLVAKAKIGNKAKASYGEIYTSRERKIVERLFSDEIERFGYEWPFGLVENV